MYCSTKSHSAFLLALILALIFVSASLFAADFKATGYTTPAYIDIELSEVRVAEPAGTVTINLIRSGDYRQTTTIDYQTSEVEASEGRDYKGAGGTIIFQPGESLKSITFEIIPDEQAESAESFTLDITGSGPNSVVTRSSTTIWIDDAPRAISQPRLEIAAAEGAILLSWEADQVCGLERSANPGSGVWEAVPCNPTAEGNRFEVAQPLGGTLYFYRLRAN